MASVWVDVELSEVQTSDLIEELENRALSEWEKSDLADIINDEYSGKFKLFLSVKDKYSLLELIEIFKEDNFVHTIPKEQLSLFKHPK